MEIGIYFMGVSIINTDVERTIEFLKINLIG